MPDVKELHEAREGIEFYKVSYQTPSYSGVPTRVTGLLAVPSGGAPNGVVVYCHGTLSDRSLSPSRLTGRSGSVESLCAAMAFASNGYAVAMPDYLGLGDDPGVHPYPLSRVNAHSVRDLLEPVGDILKSLGKFASRRLFLTGYSEGGAVCAAAAELIEREPAPSFDLMRVAPLSGPYDLIDETAKSLLSQQSNLTWLGVRFYLAANIGQSAQATVPGLSLTDYFAPSFATYIPYAFAKGLPDNKLAEKFAWKGLQLGAIKSVRRTLTSRFLRSLESKDPSDPLVRQLVENTVVDWLPAEKTLFVCLKNDHVVTERNTEKIWSRIRASGIGRDRVRKFAIVDPTLTHLTALPHALTIARRFFDAGFLAVVGSE